MSGKRSPVFTPVSWLVVLSLVLAGCGVLGPSNPNPACVPNGPGACSEIDAFPVGPLETDCGPDGLACGDRERLAYLALSMREPGLPEIVSIAQHSVDMARVCGPTLCVYTSYNAIFVFRLANGTLRAAGYQCQGVGPCFGTLHWSESRAPSRPSSQGSRLRVPAFDEISRQQRRKVKGRFGSDVPSSRPNPPALP